MTEVGRKGTGAYIGHIWNGKKWVLDPEASAEARDPSKVASLITTLPSLPGHRITQVLDVVTTLTAASGWTAGIKGNDALQRAQGMLLSEAINRGANAVVGLTCSTFGAGGGITSAFCHDAG